MSVETTPDFERVSEAITQTTDEWIASPPELPVAPEGPYRENQPFEDMATIMARRVVELCPLDVKFDTARQGIGVVARFHFHTAVAAAREGQGVESVTHALNNPNTFRRTLGRIASLDEHVVKHIEGESGLLSAQFVDGYSHLYEFKDDEIMMPGLEELRTRAIRDAIYSGLFDSSKQCPFLAYGRLMRANRAIAGVTIGDERLIPTVLAITKQNPPS